MGIRQYYKVTDSDYLTKPEGHYYHFYSGTNPPRLGCYGPFKNIDLTEADEESWFYFRQSS